MVNVKTSQSIKYDNLPAPAMAAICATVSDVGCGWFAPVPFVSGGAETNSKHYIALVFFGYIL